MNNATSDFFESTKNSVRLNLGRDLKIEEGGSISSFSEIPKQTLDEMKALAQKSSTDAVDYALFLFSKNIRRHAISFVHLVLCGKISVEDFSLHVESKK